MPADLEPGTGTTDPVWQLRLGEASLPPSASQQGAALRRRRLLLRGFWAGLAVITTGGVAAAADFLSPRDVLPSGDLVQARDVPRPGGPPFHHDDGRFWLVNLKPGGGVPEGFQQYGRPSESGGLLALSDRCPFLGQGCRVPWRPDFAFGGVIGWFRCPCCGGTFTQGGLRVFGPPPHSMDTLPILRVSFDGVRVKRGLTQRGGPDDAQRTIPAGPFAR